MRDLHDMSSVRAQIEDDVLYLLRNKIIKRKEIYDYVFHLYIKWNGFSRDMINFVDICYIRMIEDNIKRMAKPSKDESTRIIETFLDYKKHINDDNK